MGDGGTCGLAGQSGARANGGGPPPGERLYDAFVVRLWRDGASGRLLRAEVEHAATGERTRATGPPQTWVLDQIRARLGGDGERLNPRAPDAPPTTEPPPAMAPDHDETADTRMTARSEK